jgi:hypothetical protein
MGSLVGGHSAQDNFGGGIHLYSFNLMFLLFERSKLETQWTNHRVFTHATQLYIHDDIHS